MAGLNKRHRLLVIWSVTSSVLLLAIALWAFLTTNANEEAVLPGQQVDGLTSILTRDPTSGACPIRFRDVTADSGIDFRHFPDERASLLPEDMGSGVALGDFDNDGLTDIFLVNFAGSILRALPEEKPEARCRLYRNLGNMRFEDVTQRSGLGFLGFAMAAAWADYDNDGDLDLYITAYGENALFRNAGDGTFTEVTASAGAGDSRFSAGCAWADYDRDGDLDLYVANYVDFILRDADQGVPSRQYGSEQPYTLNPSAYAPQPNALFRNNGDGTFDDIAAVAGVDDPSGRSLGVAWVDMDDDGWPDLYVANDVSNNGVFRNRAKGDAPAFEDIGPGSLAADYRGAMGIAVSDFDNDLDRDLLVTHWIAQENALFRNMFYDPMFDAGSATRLWFLDSADAIGLGQASLDMVGWATAFTDFDNDGRRDLWVVNGSTFEQVDNHRLLRPQRPFVFWNRPPSAEPTLPGDGGVTTGGARRASPMSYDGDFIDVASLASPALAEPFVGRGGACADFDGDGRVDLLILAHGGRPRLLRNVSEPAGHWLAIRLRQTGGNRNAIGARVYVTADGVTQMAEVGAGASYLSQSDRTLHFGLGSSSTVDTLRVAWPDGTEEVRKRVPADQILTLAHEARYPV